MNIDFIWSPLDASYKLTFTHFNKYEWKDIEIFITAIKQTIPSSDRMYDPEIKTWFIAEKHFKFLDGMFETIAANKFGVKYNKVEKPASQTNVAKFIPIDTSIQTFEKLTGASIKMIDFQTAKKFFFKTAMKLHPDRNPNGAELMIQLNESWDNIKVKHYKQGVVQDVTN